MQPFMRTALGVSAILAVYGCGAQTDNNTSAEGAGQSGQETENTTGLVSFDEFTLDNGLKVVFHIDRSDPVVAVALTAHVGSAREKPGRTGFAHLFEHLLFLESENLGKGGLDAMSARIGGSGANGSTSRDRTNYFQTVPKDALEKMIWAEADKIGWFINTVTEPVLAKEKQVVKNEKRQGVDNQPYGHNFYVLSKALYPEDHPYNWQVIGSLEDLDAATLDDVKEFYQNWYTPNNVTLVIAGDFDPQQARQWIHKYFDEIPRGPDIERLPKQSTILNETKRLFHEDNFATLPALTIDWPTVPQYHPDSWALDVLADLLSDGKSAPLNEVLIDEKKLTANVGVFGFQSELAGEFIINIRGFDGVDLDDVDTALNDGFARFEEQGIDPKDLNRVKINQEVAFYAGIESVLGKAFNLAQYEIFAGDPGFINQDIENIKAVTANDVMRVYETYIKDRPYIASSFVPKGASELALQGSVRAEVVEEAIVQGAEEEVDPNVTASFERTPSSFDRTVEPPYGEAPTVTPPTVWEANAGALAVYGIENDELPLVLFELSFDGGHILDRDGDIDPDGAQPELERGSKPGATNLLAEIFDKGTATKTPAELEEEIAALGATIDVGVGEEQFVISGQTLARNFDATMALLAEILLEPRWDEEEFDLAKARVISQIQSLNAQPNAIADRAYDFVTFGRGHILATSVIGDEASVGALTLDDLKDYFAYLTPNLANFRVAGAIDQDETIAALASLGEQWTPSRVLADDLIIAEPAPPSESIVYFYDVPGAKQSVFRFGRPALKRTDDDFYAATVMNYRLGGGGFASRLTQELREGKGYTYGIGSGFAGSTRYGQFQISSGVRSNVTLEAAALVKEILTDYGATFTNEDLEVSKSFLLKSKARSFETLGAKLGMLENIADYGMPHDYVVQQNEIVEAMSVDRIRELADELIKPNAMNYVIVGDAATQIARLEELGFGAPVMLNDRMDGGE